MAAPEPARLRPRQAPFPIGRTQRRNRTDTPSSPETAAEHAPRKTPARPAKAERPIDPDRADPQTQYTNEALANNNGHSAAVLWLGLNGTTLPAAQALALLNSASPGALAPGHPREPCFPNQSAIAAVSQSLTSRTTGASRGRYAEASFAIAT